MKMLIPYFFTLLFTLSLDAGREVIRIEPYLHEIIFQTKEIKVPGFQGAYNPSIVETEEGYLLSFRWHPNRSKLWISEVGLWRLDKELRPLAPPQLIKTRTLFDPTPSQSEDARLISLQGKLYLLYNDNIEVANTTPKDRRDLFLTEIVFNGKLYRAKKPLKLTHPEHVLTRQWEKNWVPFVKDDELLLSYSINPHEVLLPDLETGEAPTIATSRFPTNFWGWGPIRGGTPAIELDEHYLAFFHSWIRVGSYYHYYMGAYTFEKECPFQVTAISSKPLSPLYFYRSHVDRKKVIFPGGVIDKGDSFLILYGVDDCQIFYCLLSKKAVYDTLIQIPIN